MKNGLKNQNYYNPSSSELKHRLPKIDTSNSSNNNSKNFNQRNNRPAQFRSRSILYNSDSSDEDDDEGDYQSQSSQGRQQQSQVAVGDREDNVQSPVSVATSSSSSSSVLVSPELLPHDDNDLIYEPQSHVDYLSHDWKESDISKSWKYIVMKRKDVANSARLENASWRTWAQAKYKLKTVSPESVNWLKDSEVTWLYGPLYKEPGASDFLTDELSPKKDLKNIKASSASPALSGGKNNNNNNNNKNNNHNNNNSNNNNNNNNNNDDDNDYNDDDNDINDDNNNNENSVVNDKYGTSKNKCKTPNNKKGPKPILKKRTAAEMMLSQAEFMKLSIIQAHHHNSHHKTGSPILEATTPSHYHQRTHRQSPPVVKENNKSNNYTNNQNNNNNNNSNGNSPYLNNSANRTDDENALSSPTISNMNLESSDSIGAITKKSSFSTPSNSQPKKDRHIRFNEKVEQCIAVDIPSSDEEDFDYEDDQGGRKVVYQGGYNTDDEGGLYNDSENVDEEEDDEDDEDGGFFLNVKSNSMANMKHLQQQKLAKANSNDSTTTTHNDSSSDENTLISSASHKISKPFYNIIELLPNAKLKYNSTDDEDEDIDNKVEEPTYYSSYYENPYPNRISHNVNTNRNYDYHYNYNYNSIYTNDTSANDIVTQNNDLEVYDLPDNLDLGSLIHIEDVHSPVTSTKAVSKPIDIVPSPLSITPSASNATLRAADNYVTTPNANDSKNGSTTTISDQSVDTGTNSAVSSSFISNANADTIHSSPSGKVSGINITNPQQPLPPYQSNTSVSGQIKTSFLFDSEDEDEDATNNKETCDDQKIIKNNENSNLDGAQQPQSQHQHQHHHQNILGESLQRSISGSGGSMITSSNGSKFTNNDNSVRNGNTDFKLNSSDDDLSNNNSSSNPKRFSAKDLASHFLGSWKR
ncbi:hypothetical protein PACTADRAFT_31675 [Pachysolen tannophilus NRRL Y-2460]|uniref:Nitrogen regulatory protein areA GATA-like domain-containing protein n=1 Tax=Pachysolen tannophilus NRRL Y-2460 TaxID=669874 RepID=A0A1E4U2N9_PACTA|nr:hypothetical protein PACTADRAFT_31675 [Pachysolen tannophilus NRRL Y-2460]